MTKAEADRLGWETPRGAKLDKAPERGSPAEKAGLRPAISSSRSTASWSTRRPNSTPWWTESGRAARCSSGALHRTRAPRRGDDRRAAEAASGRRPDGPQLMLDTGGHMALVNGLAFTPDGEAIDLGGRRQGHARMGLAGRQDRTRVSAAKMGLGTRARSSPWRCRRTGAGWRWRLDEHAGRQRPRRPPLRFRHRPAGWRCSRGTPTSSRAWPSRRTAGGCSRAAAGQFGDHLGRREAAPWCII